MDLKQKDLNRKWLRKKDTFLSHFLVTADLSHATIDISNLLPQGPHPWEKGNSVVFARSIVVDINVLSFFPLRCCAHTSINLSIHPFIHPASQPSIHPSVHPSIRPSGKKKPKQIQKQTNEKVDMT